MTVSADIVSFHDDPVSRAHRLASGRDWMATTRLIYSKDMPTRMNRMRPAELGEVVLYRINGASLVDLGAQQVTLDPNKDYRFVLDIQGTQLHGQVFEIGGGMVAERFATDATHASGFSGLFAYSQNPLPPVDVTWDNFSSQVPEPSTILLAIATAGMLLVGRRVRSAA